MESGITALVRRFWPMLVLCAGLIAIVLIGHAIGSTLLNRTIAEGLLRLVIVVAIYIFMGNSGIISFGSIAYVMIGAYASAWLTLMPNLKKLTLPGLPDFIIETQLDLLSGAVLAGGMAAFCALVVAAIIMRMTAIGASIATFATLAMIYVIYNNWETVTLGTSSIIGLQMYVDMYVALGWALAALIVAYLYQISRFGIALRASREDEVAARAVGINVYTQRIIAFTIHGFFAGIGGVLHGHFLGILTVDTFYLEMTFITLAMLVVGGQNSLSGAVVGVVVITAATEIFRQFEKGFEVGGSTYAAPLGMQEILLAAVMLLVLIFRPSGLMGGREIPWPFGRPQILRPVTARAIGAEVTRRP